MLVTTGTASATWSIVVINLKTREVCVAAATCIPNTNLRRLLAVVRVGQGAAAAQSAIDVSGINRMDIFQGFIDELSPQEILDILAMNSGHESRQYGIASFAGAPVTFTGNLAGLAASGVTGSVDDLVYAVQGNVLTDDAVVLAAEAALRNTVGDLSQRVMAGMEAARALGGDGRCSCDPINPTQCGAPPAGFVKSAHSSFIVIARLGDEDGVCTLSQGCANGDYYLRRGFNGGVNDIDPIIELQNRVDIWRAGLSGIADQQLSRVQANVQELVGDGVSKAFVTVDLIDIDGVPLSAGGHTLNITPIHPGPDPAVLGPVTDLGNGSYEFELTATTNVGRSAFEIRVDDNAGSEVLLWPPLGVRVVEATDFHVSHYEVSAAELSTQVRMTLTHPDGAAAVGRPYVVLASLSGSSPGTALGGVTVPLNQDRLLHLTATGMAAPPVFEDFVGAFGAEGRASAKIFLGTGLGSALIGQRVDLAALYQDGQGAMFVSEADFFRIVP